MTTLLHISSSPRGPEESESLALAATFIEQYTQVHPDVEVETFDLWDGSLPDFGRGAARAKMAVFAGEDPSGELAAPWARAIQTFERFAAADSYLFSVPMWNHGIPYILKQLIDVISQPGYLFDFDVTRGYIGRLHGKKAAVLYTSAVYGRGLAPEFGHDFQSTYLRDWLVWAGVTEVSEAEFRPNLVTADAVTQRAIAHAEVADLAKAF
ncbi:MAG: NAD(P)H-dependent oxidoreductase [Nocardioidaceae bacterium]